MKTRKRIDIFSIFNHTFMVIISITMLYPFLNKIAASFSSDRAIQAGQVSLFPVDFNTIGYKAVFENIMFTYSFRNTVIITVAGTIISMSCILTAAYALSRKELVGNKVFFYYIIFTMFFNGGMIPTYLIIRQLKLYDTLWSMILPGAVIVYNMIVAKSFFTQLPESIIESSVIDGCNDMGVFFRIILPVSKPVIAALTLFTAVGLWNTFMAGVLYTSSSKNFPLQVYVRGIIFQTDAASYLSSEMQSTMNQLDTNFNNFVERLKAAVLIVTTLPIICIYPFLQKHFVKGIMVGAIKG